MVGLDYHVEVDRHHYSVPHRLLRQKVWARLTERTVEIFHDGQRVAAHLRSPLTAGTPPCATTCRRATGDTPTGRRRRSAVRRRRSAPAPRRWSPRSCASAATPSRASAPAWASCGWPAPTIPNGSRRPARRALEIGARSYTSVSSILNSRLDRRRPDPATEGPAISHPNIRGAGYFH